MDAVSFENQTTNIGLARVPNGTGSFITQTATFGITNDFPTSVEPDFAKPVWNVSPNPACQFAEIKINSPNVTSILVEVINLQGMRLWVSECQFEQGGNQVEIPVNQFCPGVYHIQLTDLNNGVKVGQQ